MGIDFGGDQKPIDKTCNEVSDGVFERRFQKITVQLDCNTFTASFNLANNTAPPSHIGGYGGLGLTVPRTRQNSLSEAPT
eukprot:COSAG02_NODE_4091_length_5797_cov_127.687434_1_plen_80_part_00